MRIVMQTLSRLRRETDGTASTVEAALWLPLFVLFLTLIIDVSSIYNRQSQMLRIVQDANRAFAIGLLGNEQQTQDYIQGAIATYSNNTTIVTQKSAGIITTTLTIPATDLMPVNKFAVFNDKNITLRAQQLAEY